MVWLGEFHEGWDVAVGASRTPVIVGQSVGPPPPLSEGCGGFGGRSKLEISRPPLLNPSRGKAS